MSELIATLKRANGEVIAKVPLPRSAADVSLVRYVSFLNEMKKFELEGANPIMIMAQAVSEFSGIPLAELLTAKMGEQWSKDKDLDGGIRSLYGWVVNALANYKGEARSAKDFGFEYKGASDDEPQRFQIPYIVAAELAGGMPVLPEVETGEAIDAFETMRGFNQQIKETGDPKGERARRIRQIKEAMVKQGDESGDMAREMRRLEAEIDYEGDPNGNLRFAQYLRLIAILCRKTGERLPSNDGDRERWIQGRMLYFHGIDCKTALDVDFFLSGLLMRSKQTHPVVGSLILPLFALAAAIQSKQPPKGMRTIEQYRTRRKYKNGLVGVR